MGPRGLAVLFASCVFARVEGRGCRCNVGEKVWAKGWATVVSRAVTVELQWEKGGRATLPATEIRTRFGQLCACAALCFFGRVGNLQGKFHEGGSAEAALEVAAGSVWEHVVRANSEMQWDIFAHTWDEHLAGAIQEAYSPRRLSVAGPAPNLAVESFAASVARSNQLKREEEKERGFRYDLVVLMRYDIFFRKPLKLWLGNGTLWTGHWCSIHSEDLAIREVVLGDSEQLPSQIRRSSGVFAASQFVLVGLMDFWFAGASQDLDAFALWGRGREQWLRSQGLSSDTAPALLHREQMPLDLGHFHTFQHAKQLRLKLSYTGLSYVDFTLVRWKDCELEVGDLIRPPNLFCHHWEISVMRQCMEWVLMGNDFAERFCPIAGRRAFLRPGSGLCGRF